MVYPIELVAQLPYSISSSVTDYFGDRNRLVSKIEALEHEILALSGRVQDFDALLQENHRLRELLGSSPRGSGELIIAHLIGIVPDAQRREVIVNKGTSDGVFQGAAVLDAQGVYGQVIDVQNTTSQILLANDRRFAVPVEVKRSAVRSVAAGTGGDYMVLENVRLSADIKNGDEVITSGLGDVYPAGYMVGTVVSRTAQRSEAVAQIKVMPAAMLNSTRLVSIVIAKNTP